LSPSVREIQLFEPTPPPAVKGCWISLPSGCPGQPAWYAKANASIKALGGWYDDKVASADASAAACAVRIAQFETFCGISDADAQYVAVDAAQYVKVSSCTASSEYSSTWSCMKAFDGVTAQGRKASAWASKGEGAGSWIQANFKAPAELSKFSYMQRECQCEHNKGIVLEFSDGSIQSFILSKSNLLQTFKLDMVTTTYVKVYIITTYTKVNNGAKEIQFFGTTKKAALTPAVVTKPGTNTVVKGNGGSACPKSTSWCTHPGSTYVLQDCDGDGKPDHTCGDLSENFGVIQTAHGCVDSWPKGQCTKKQN